MDFPVKTLLRYWGSHLKRASMAEGSERLYGAFREAGWRVVLVLSRPPEDPRWLDPIHAAKIEIAYMPRPSGQFDLRCILGVRDLCRRYQADVFHCDNMHTSPTIGAALARVPVRLWSKRAMDPYVEQMRPPRLRERLALSTRITAGLATQVLAVSSGVKLGLMERGIPAGKITVLHNPRTASGEPRRSRGEMRTQLEVADGEIVIMTVGHSVAVKGWDVLLEAFRLIVADVPAARLLFVGSTSSPDEQPVYAKLVVAIERDGLGGRVRFIGYTADPASTLMAADIYVASSFSEGYGMALVEALDAKLPCVTTRVGIAEDFLRDGENGFLVPPNDPAALADAIRKLATNPALREQFSRRAQADIQAPSVEEFSQRSLELYESLLSQARRSEGEAASTSATRA